MMKTFSDWYFDLFESGVGSRLNQQEIAEDAWDYQQSKVDEITQLYAKELFNKKVVAKKASEKLAGLQLQNDELQKRVDAAKYYMKNIFSGDAEVDQCHLGDLLDILDGKIVDEIEQALKGEHA